MDYGIKCDDCKITVGKTDSPRESAAGGLCTACRQEAASAAERVRLVINERLLRFTR